METVTGYIGTYATENGGGIYRFQFNGETQSFTEMKLAYPMRDAKYLSLYENWLVAPCMEDEAGITLIDLDAKNLPYSLFMEDQTACYVTQDDEFVYTANYHEGCVLIYQKEDAKLKFHKRIDSKEHAGCHQVILHEHYLMVPCLLLDKIMIYDCQKDYEVCGELTFAEGSGPRHGVFTKNHETFYLISELSNELYQYRVDGVQFTLVKQISLLENVRGGGAALRLSEDEKTLYASIRGSDTIHVIDAVHMQVMQMVSSGGEHPRDIALSPKGDYLLAVNRYSNNLVVYERDQKSGLVKNILDEISVPEGVSIVFEESEDYNK